ncbi:MAG TPA: ABC transporter permease [bacterium]|nr:ABC transporter permease [bacterium]
MKEKAVGFGGAIVLGIVLMALFPQAIAVADPNRIDVSVLLAGPSLAHPLGTDELGRDVWSRVVVGARVSLIVALAAVGSALVAGSIIGVVAAWASGRVDNLIMRLMDLAIAFPSILLAMMIIAALGLGARSVIIAIALVNTPGFARIARAAVLGIKGELYIEAARALGAHESWIITHHVLPNILPPLMVGFSVSMGFAIIVEASLSFLGLGLPPPHPAWGSMLFKGKDFMEISPWGMIGPGLALTLTVVGFNLLGDGMRDLFDPTDRR